MEVCMDERWPVFEPDNGFNQLADDDPHKDLYERWKRNDTEWHKIQTELKAIYDAE